MNLLRLSGTAWWCVAIVSLLNACGVTDETVKAHKTVSHASSLDRPFVVFTEAELVLRRLEAPVAPPVTVGSSPSLATLTSDAPDVVSVRPDGNLVAHRRGTALIGGTGGGRLLVRVEPPEAKFTIAPSRLELSRGKSEAVQLLGVYPDAVVWATSDPSVARVNAGVIEAVGVGVARILAMSETHKAVVEVVVKGEASLSIAAAPRSIRIGEIVALRAITIDRKPVEAGWRTGSPRVVAHLGAGVFEAKAVGKARICAEWHDAKTCTSVEVVR